MFTHTKLINNLLFILTLPLHPQELFKGSETTEHRARGTVEVVKVWPLHHLAERNLLCIMMLHCIYNGIVLGIFAFISIYYFLQALEQREKKDFKCTGVMYLMNSVFFI